MPGMYRSTTKMKKKTANRRFSPPKSGRGATSDFETMLMRQARMRPLRRKGGGGR